MRGLLAGLALLSGLIPGAAAARSPVQLALTFDDLPAHGVLLPGETRISVIRAIVAALEQARVGEAFGFVAGSFGAGDPDAPAVLKAWRRAGFPLANHSWTHASLDGVAADWYLADAARNEAVLKPLMRGRDWRWFRYPFLAEGTDPAKRDAVRLGLVARGYRIAPVTVSFNDYAYNDPFARCSARHDTAAIARLEALYLSGAEITLDQARAVGGSHIVLLHTGAFTARMLPRLLAGYRSGGVRYVSLARASRSLKATSPLTYNPPVAELEALCTNAG